MKDKLFENASSFLVDNYNLSVEELIYANSCSTLFYGVEDSDGDWVFTLVSGSFAIYGFEDTTSLKLSEIKKTYSTDNFESEIFGRDKVRQRIDEYIEAILSGKRDTVGFVTKIAKESITVPGKKMWMNVRLVRVETENGLVISGELTDSTEYGMAYYDVNKNLHIDRTTQLFNRNTLALHLEDEDWLKESAFVYINIDNFRKFNTEYSYVFGDKVLAYFGNEIQNLTADDTSAYRIASDEFFIKFKYDDVEEINKVMLLLKRRLKNITIDDNTVSIPFSFGVMRSSDFGDRSINTILTVTGDKMIKHKQSRKILMQPSNAVVLE